MLNETQTPGGGFRIRYELVKNGHPPIRASKGAAAWDLSANIDIGYRWFPRGDSGLVKLGMKAAIPQGYVGLLSIRSGLAKAGMMLVNGVGIIDPDYRGEVCALLRATVKDVKIHHGQRVAQLTIVRAPKIDWVEGILDDTTRGSGGFGSTGV